MKALIVISVLLQAAENSATANAIVQQLLNTDKTLIEVYLILCIISFPVMVLIFFLLARFTNLFERLNNWLDKKAQKKDKKKKNEHPATVESNSENNDADQSQKELTEDDDEIARFRLYVGNGYKCRLPDDDPSNMKVSEWKSENQFVGDFNKGRNSNLFKAQRVGSSCLLFNDKTYYELFVLPNNPSWFADKYFNMLLEGKSLDLLKLEMANDGRKILMNDFHKGNFSYEGSGKIRRISFSANMKDSKISRVLFEMKFEEEDLPEFIADLEERMAPLKKYDYNGIEIKETDIKLWYHETLRRVNGKLIPKVDLVAFLKKLSTGGYSFGIGKSWRLLAERVEIQDNRNMILKSFFALLPDELKKIVEMNDKSFVDIVEDEEMEEKEDRSETPVSTANVSVNISSEENGGNSDNDSSDATVSEDENPNGPDTEESEEDVSDQPEYPEAEIDIPEESDIDTEIDEDEQSIEEIPEGSEFNGDPMDMMGDSDDSTIDGNE